MSYPDYEQASGNSAQHHLESQQTKFGLVEDDVYYGGPVLEHLHSKDTPRGYPDVYVNGEDVTVTVDPLKNAQWMLPHNSERHSFTIHRGALKDHAAVTETVRLINGQIEGPIPCNFECVSRMLDRAHKFTPRCTHNSSRGRANHGDNWGRLPVISQSIYSNLLRDIPDWLIEDQLRIANTHADRTRFFDCGSRGFPTVACR